MNRSTSAKSLYMHQRGVFFFVQRFYIAILFVEAGVIWSTQQTEMKMCTQAKRCAQFGTHTFKCIQITQFSRSCYFSKTTRRVYKCPLVNEPARHLEHIFFPRFACSEYRSFGKKMLQIVASVCCVCGCCCCWSPMINVFMSLKSIATLQLHALL